MLLLGGCAAGSVGGPVAVLPVMPAAGYLGVPASVGGKAVEVVLDTGAQSSLISDDAVAALGLRADARRTTHLIGVEGVRVEARNAIVPRLTLGHVETGEISLPVGVLVERLRSQVAGLIGLDVLGQFDLDIDRPDGVVTLYRQTGAGPPWLGKVARIGLRRTRDTMLLVPVTLDGVRLEAVVDTGSRRTMVSAGAAARLGILPSVLAAEPVTEARGVDETSGFGHLHRFADVRIGPLEFHDVRIDVGSTRLETGDMLLGEDFFRQHRVWLAPSTPALWVAVGPWRTNGEAVR